MRQDNQPYSDMQQISLFADISRYAPVKEDKRQKFQVIGKEIQDWFHLDKFPLFIFLQFNHQKIDDAFITAKKNEGGKFTNDLEGFKYFCGTVKNKK